MSTARGAGISWWASASASTLVPVNVSVADDAAGRLQSVRLPGVVVSRLSGPGGEFARTSDLIATNPGGAVLLSIALRGVLYVSDGRGSEVGTTAFCFADRPYVIGTESAYDVVTVRAPLRLLPPRNDSLRHASPLSPDHHDRHVGLLRDLSLSILSRERHDAFEQRTWSEVTIGLLSLLIRGSGDVSGPTADKARAATFEAAVDMIERCHRDAALTIDDIAQQCQVSRRELELAFAAHGSSPASHLRRVRLQSSLALLCGDARPATISSIAHEVGFADVTTFTRSFRREFQTTPHRWRRFPVECADVESGSNPT